MILDTNSDQIPTVIAIIIIIVLMIIGAIIAGIRQYFKIEELEYKQNCEMCSRKLETARESREGICRDCEMDMNT